MITLEAWVNPHEITPSVIKHGCEITYFFCQGFSEDLPHHTAGHLITIWLFNVAMENHHF